MMLFTQNENLGVLWETQEKISTGLKEFIKPNAVEKIVDDILNN